MEGRCAQSNHVQDSGGGSSAKLQQRSGSGTAFSGKISSQAGFGNDGGRDRRRNQSQIIGSRYCAADRKFLVRGGSFALKYDAGIGGPFPRGRIADFPTSQRNALCFSYSVETDR